MTKDKRDMVRIISITVAIVFVLAGAFSALRLSEKARTAALFDADRKLFLHMAEEAENASRLASRLSSGDTVEISDLLEFCRTCNTIVSSAALHSDTKYIQGAARLYASAEARAEHAVSTQATSEAVPPWLSVCMKKSADLLSDAAVLFLASEDGDLPSDVLPLLDEFSALCAAFAPDPLTVFDSTNVRTAYRFDAETKRTERELWDDLEFALGKTTAALFYSIDLPTDEEASANDARCVFSCKNGYAELSLRGGHLLHYALYPTQAIHGEHAGTRLSNVDLEEKRNAFLSKNGMPIRLLSPFSEKEEHGIHYYTFCKKGEHHPSLTVGIRVSDGDVFYFDGEEFYKR